MFHESAYGGPQGVGPEAYLNGTSQGAYYKNGREITWPDMNWAPLPADSRQITGGSKD